MSIPRRNNQYIQFGDTPSVDAFGKARVSEAVTLFDSQLEYWDYAPLWHTIFDVGATGTTTHLPNEASLSLNTTGDIGSKVIRQTKEYFRYNPAKSQFINLSCVMGANSLGVRKRVGYFDEKNGVYFEKGADNINYVVLRSYTTGSVSEKRIPQSEWNLDNLDGDSNGGVDIEFDFSKAQIFVIDMEWLGVGRVRCGFNIDGLIIYVHEFKNSNINDSVYMTTANLPVRYEIENISSTEPCSMKQICSSVMSEGGVSDVAGCFRSADSGTTLKAVSNGVRTPIVSVRPKTHFNGKENRGIIKPQSYQLFNNGNYGCYIEIVLNGTLTGANFVGIDTDCIGEKDISATAITGGTVIFSGYIGATNTSPVTGLASAKSKKVLTVNYDATDSETLTIVVTPIGGNTTIAGAIEILSLF
ncbi:hypothetical protein [uncultured Arcobacter sp.]|uniref:hypothetical protein n=1 Tax=uncultured Arcobacter sp. TaxID=165434 RepID=UPI002615A38D|nr:hypothetical protein [uncultured Arcobacter sp.]